MCSIKEINLNELSANWPPLGPGKHSDLIKRQNDILKLLVDEVLSLKHEIMTLKQSNDNYKKELAHIKNISHAEQQPITFASIVTGQSSELKQQRNDFLNLIASDTKDKNEREKNVVIHGLPQSTSINDTESVSQLFKAVDESNLTLRSSSLGAIKIKTLRRLKPSTSTNPGLILVSFFNNADRDKVIKGCTHHKANNFAKVIIREDRTPSQQAAFTKQRQEIKLLNDELHENKLLEKYRYIIHKSRKTIVCIDLHRSEATKSYVIVSHNTIIDLKRDAIANSSTPQ